MAKLDLNKSQKMEMLPDCPLHSDAAYTNILYSICPLTKKGYIYRIAKHKTKLILLRYSLSDEEEGWSKLSETPAAKNIYLTLMPIFNGRFIAILGERMPLIYDLIHNQWIKTELAPGSHPIVPR